LESSKPSSPELPESVFAAQESGEKIDNHQIATSCQRSPVLFNFSLLAIDRRLLSVKTGRIQQIQEGQQLFCSGSCVHLLASLNLLENCLLAEFSDRHVPNGWIVQNTWVFRLDQPKARLDWRFSCPHRDSSNGKTGRNVIDHGARWAHLSLRRMVTSSKLPVARFLRRWQELPWSHRVLADRGSF
jgi:hypothetical protein